MVLIHFLKNSHLLLIKGRLYKVNTLNRNSNIKTLLRNKNKLMSVSIVTLLEAFVVERFTI